MDIWEKSTGIKKPITCNRKAICCQMATILKPWEKLSQASSSPGLKDFFNIFIPYGSREIAHQKFPSAYEECLSVVESRENTSIEDLYFYHCQFLKQPNECLIYEDRPSLCRSFPESPMDAIPRECGYFAWSERCKQHLEKMKHELDLLKRAEYEDYPFFVVSPGYSWI